MKILIADDHAIVRRGLRSLLEQEHPTAKISEAQDSSEATDLLMAQTWNLILLDISMPGRSGLDVLEDARRLQPQTPVIMLSLYPEEEFAMRSMKLGAAAYLNKQSASDELITAVRCVLDGHKYITTSLAERMAATLGGEIPSQPHEALSHRELQVLRMIALGQTLKEIAAELVLSEKTIATYRSRISQKMGLGTKVELTRYALQHKLVE